MKMKTLYTILFFLCFGIAQAQPQKINYQAVALNASGVAVKNKVISMRFSILDSSATGSVLYSETHQPTTDGSGQFSVYLGGGTVVSGTFSNIPWGNNKSKFLKTESDYTGSSNYSLMGVSQLVSVPYALAAGSLGEGATITGANGSQYTLTMGTNGPTWTLSNSNVNFSCGQSVSYSGESYPTVQIGTQCWFQKNLNVGTMIQGVNDQTNNSTFEKYCYNNDTANCTIYGGLYQWAELVQYQNGASNTTSPSPSFSGNIKGMCPFGWHIPSDSEYCILTKYLDSTADCTLFSSNSTKAGGKLKSTSGLWNSPNTGASNSSMFSALPCGYRHTTGSFNNLGLSTYFWSNNENSVLNSIYRSLNSNFSTINRNNSFKNNGYSVRCLKD
jgi:uncharacterized protein (TIGR02145 family)